jgi:hypothetical protein
VHHFHCLIQNNICAYIILNLCVILILSVNTMIIDSLCPPAVLYLGFSLIQIIIDLFRGQQNSAFKGHCHDCFYHFTEPVVHGWPHHSLVVHRVHSVHHDDVCYNHIALRVWVESNQGKVSTRTAGPSQQAPWFIKPNWWMHRNPVWVLSGWHHCQKHIRF